MPTYWEMLGTVRISYNITQKVIWSLLEFLTVPWDPQYVSVPNLAPADNRINMTTKENKFQAF